MTIEATTWCFARLVQDFEKPGAVRRKAQKEKVEGTAESACLLWHLAMDLQAQFPISKEVVEKHILEPWADGSHGWDLELHEILSEKREKMAVTDSKMFRNVVDICNCKAPLPSANPELLVSKLDDDRWSATWPHGSCVEFPSSWKKDRICGSSCFWTTPSHAMLYSMSSCRRPWTNSATW